MHNYKLALFFAVLLRIASLISKVIILTFAYYCVLQIFVGATSSCSVGVLPLCLLFRCVGGFQILFVCAPFFFLCLLMPFVVFFGTFASPFFGVISGLRLAYFCTLLLLSAFACLPASFLAF